MGLEEDVIKMKKEVKSLKEESIAFQILEDYKRTNQRQFVIILVILVMWFATIGYLVYTLNDIGVEETTTTVEQSDAENNNYIGNDGVIVNGSENKTN